VPPEYNEFLPKDCEEYKKLKAVQSGEDTAAEGVAQLKLNDGTGGAGEPPGAAAAAAAAAADGGGKSQTPQSSKKKKSAVAMVVIERNTRNKKKCITTVAGLHLFGVKLSEAAKLFGKKFASGSSVTKNAEGKEQIDVQGDVLDQMAELIVKQFKEVKRGDVYYIEGKKKERYFSDE
jgi:density-regulated protein